MYKDKKKEKEWKRKYNQKNKEKIKDYNKKYHKEYYHKHRDEELKKQKKYRDENVDKVREQSRKKYEKYKVKAEGRQLKHKYGITLEQYNELLIKQNNVCAICLKSENIKHKNGVSIQLSVDHNHTTGNVRGLLCYKCNSMLGWANDNVIILERAKEYLIKYD